jgi:DNA-binding IclR family transcriptional regulator
MAKAIHRLLDVLELFVDHAEGLSLPEITRLGKMSTATVWRYVSTLVERGYLAERANSGVYQLGLKPIDFSYAARRNLRFIELAYVPMARLSRETKYDVYMTVLDAFTSLVVEEIGATAALRINSPVGRRMGLHSTACGKVHLAFMPEDERRAFYDSGKLERYTKNTITDPDKLEAELELVRRDGVAYDREEQRLGVWVVAAPVYTGNAKIAAAGLITPISRMKADTAEKNILKIISCTGEISQILSRGA